MVIRIPSRYQPSRKKELKLLLDGKRREIDAFSKKIRAYETNILQHPRTFQRILTKGGYDMFVCLVVQSREEFEVDHIIRQIGFTSEVARTDFVAPMVESSVGYDMKEAFIRLTSLKHKVRMERSNNVGSPNEQCNILLAAYRLGSLVRAQAETEERTPAEKRDFIDALNKRLHGCKPDRRGRELMALALNTAQVVQTVGEFILLRPEILSESIIKRCSKQELPIVLNCLAHFLPPYVRTYSVQTMTTPGQFFLAASPEGRSGSCSGNEGSHQATSCDAINTEIS